MKKKRTLYAKQAINGHLFCLPLYIGVILFFGLPLVQSIIYCFSKVTPEMGNMSTEFTGLENLHYIFRVDTDYINNLISSFTGLTYQVPFILIVSLFLATIINQKFHGRVFVRAVFFLPVIVASGVVIDIIQSDALSSMMLEGDGQSDTIFNSIVLVEFLEDTGLSTTVIEYFTKITNNIMDLLWKTGIQTLMFLAGLQSISPTLYEASAVEGATGWENFWMITFPMLVPIMLVNTVYTVVDSFTDLSNGVMKQIVGCIGNIEYGKAAAMGWVYTLIMLIVLALVFFVFRLSDRKGRRR